MTESLSIRVLDLAMTPAQLKTEIYTMDQFFIKNGLNRDSITIEPTNVPGLFTIQAEKRKFPLLMMHLRTIPSIELLSERS